MSVTKLTKQVSYTETVAEVEVQTQDDGRINVNVIDKTTGLRQCVAHVREAWSTDAHRQEPFTSGHGVTVKTPEHAFAYNEKNLL